VKKKERRRPYVERAVLWRISALVMGLWLAGMIYLTITVAQTEYLRFADDVKEYVSDKDRFDYDPQKDELENAAQMLSDVRGFSFHRPKLDIPFYTEYATATEYIPRLRPKLDTNDWTVAVYDASGRRILGENNYVYLTYYNTPNTYNSNPAVVGYTYIDLNRTECGRAMIDEWQDHNGYYHYSGVSTLRLTGYFDEEEFVLVDVAHPTNKNRFTLQWESNFDGDKSSPMPTVDIYPSDMIMDHADCEVRLADGVMELEEVTQSNITNGSGGLKENWESTEELLRDHSRLGNIFRKEQLRWNSNNLFESVITKRGSYLDADGNQCTYVASVRVEPIRTAIALLPEVYLLTFALVIMFLLIVWLRIRRELILPLEHMTEYARINYPSIWRKVNTRWLEPHILQNELMASQDRIRELKKENIQLSTALDYAHHAEQIRRRMVSNITHELKTPLAVISSYAEGLKEGIAADKQDHYLNVVLEETRRMDGMVLEMLDLSRLEAGKVRLATDRFSLLELTRRIVDKLSFLVEEKNLKVEYVWSYDFEITADEGRITQAVTNLVTNAMKYSPQGGTIAITVSKAKDKVTFAIENQSEPLTQEALDQLWDSFYRVDTARTEKGTGLGLPITKAIIELHGGTCHVSNTSVGVEFKFYLP
jgi:signal transduction histidine kinase